MSDQDGNRWNGAVTGLITTADDFGLDRAVNEAVRQKYRVNSQLLHSWKLAMPQKLPYPLDYLAGKEFFAPLPEAFLRVMRGEGME